MKNNQKRKIESLLEASRESGSVVFQDIAGREDIIVEISSFSPLIPADWDGPAEGGEVEIVIHDDCGEDITNNIRENFPHDYSRIKDKAYSIVVLSKED